MNEQTINPCVFKRACNTCKKAALDERPEMCEALKCEDYLPCPRCNKNRTLHDAGKHGSMCKVCLSGNSNALREWKKEQEQQIKNDNTVRMPKRCNSNSGIDRRQVSITPPGTPPSELSTQEIEFYEGRWNEYKGYYRDPAAYFACHVMILMEINITHMQSMLVQSRGELKSEYLKEVSYSLQMLKSLKSQLPEKESQDIMDDEKSIAYIYAEYEKEITKRRVRGVSRIFSPAALALAPALQFPVDPHTLLKQCGFQEIEIQEALNKISHTPIERTPDDVLEFFGFTIKEEYAMQVDSPLKSHITEEATPDALDLQQEVSTGNINKPTPRIKLPEDEETPISVIATDYDPEALD